MTDASGGESSDRRGAEEVVRVLKEAGHEAFFAGGCVRDLVLGLRPKDYDVATSAHPDAIARLFRRTKQMGAAFGVVQVQLQGHAYEVATFRDDGAYTDGRRPDAVRFADTVEEDVARRDFTINALMMDPFSGRVVDLVEGQADIAAGLVRAVGEPDCRFAEDRLRMLRAVRFAARFGFRIERRTERAIVAHASEVGAVSVERIVGELDAMFAGPRPEEAVKLLDGLGLAARAIPFLPRAPEARVARFGPFAQHAWRELPREDRLTAAWAFLLGDATDAEADLRPMRASKERMRRVQLLLDRRDMLVDARAAPAVWTRIAADEPVALMLAYAEGLGAADGAERLRAAASDLRARPLPRRPLVTGRDLQELGYAPGRRFKEILSAVDARVLERALVDRPTALAWVQATYPIREG